MVRLSGFMDILKPKFNLKVSRILVETNSFFSSKVCGSVDCLVSMGDLLGLLYSLSILHLLLLIVFVRQWVQNFVENIICSLLYDTVVAV